MISFLKIYFSLFTPFIYKIPVVWKGFCTPKAFVMLPFFTLPIITPQVNVFIFLFFASLFDFATGVAVSYYKKKDEKEKLEKDLKTKELEALKNKRLITSDKLKRTGVKSCLYISSILVAYWADETLKINTIHFEFSQIGYTVTICVTLWWIIIEIYSIFFENFKYLGFDILKLFTNIKKVYKEIRSIKE